MSKRDPFIRITRDGDAEPLGAGLVSDEERRRLHDLLDRIIDQRENLEGWRAENPPVNALLPASTDPKVVLGKRLADQAARLAFDAAIDLVVEALSKTRAQALLAASDDPESIRLALWLRLHRVKRLIDGATSVFGKTNFPLSRVLDELENLSYGEVGEIFRAPPLRPSQRHNRGKLAKLRLNALKWERWLRCSQSMSPVEAHIAIATAFKTDWDAIRKWRASCAKILGARSVKSFLEFSKVNQPRLGFLGDWQSGLQFDGDEYQAALRAEPPKRKA